jgi:hypothetical protein
VYLSLDESEQLKNEFTASLDKNYEEQVYQEFMEQNTSLIPREFVLNHGIHLDLVIRKLSLGADYKPDFFFITKSSIEWNIVLIEIEKPQSRFFKENSTKLHKDFHDALDQIDTWRSWFSNQSNMSAFLNHGISQIRRSDQMRSNSCFIKYILVHGRRSEYESSEMRRSLIREKERDGLRILSFDSLCENLNKKYPLYLGIKKNTHLEVKSTQFLGESLFTYLDPTFLRVTDELKNDALANRDRWRHIRIVSQAQKYAMDEVLPKVGRCTI